MVAFKRWCLPIIGSVLLAFVGMASAGPITVPIKLLSKGGPAPMGVGVYPYIYDINGNTVNAMCDDYLDKSTIGQSWTAAVYSASNPGGAIFSSLANAGTDYKEAAWLQTQFASHPNDVASIQYAVWDIFDPSAPKYGNSAMWMALATAQSKTGFGGMNFGDFLIYTPFSWKGSRPQEIIAEVPEPATLVLFFSGLLLLGWAGFRRARKLRPALMA